MIPVILPMTAASGVYSTVPDIGMLLSFMLKRGIPDGQTFSQSLFVEMDTTPNHGGYGLGVAMGRRRRALSRRASRSPTSPSAASSLAG